MFLWIIEHIISAIPVWIWAFAAGGGAAAFVLGGMVERWPGIKPYAAVTRYVGLAVFTAAVFMIGGTGVTTTMQDAIKEAQAKVAQAEKDAQNANDALKKKSAEKVKVIQGKEIIVKQYIDREVTKYDNTCPVPAPVVKALNAAATGDAPK